MHDGWMEWGPGGWGGMGLGPILVLLVLLLIVWFVVVAMRKTGGGEGKPASRRSAREILDERFASGEIDRKEYDEKRRALAE